MYVPRNLQIYTILKLRCANLKLRNCKRNFEIAQPRLRNFKIAQLSLRNFEIALHKLGISKLRSVISKVDLYSNIKQTCTFPQIQKLACRIPNSKYESVFFNTNCVKI